MTLGCPERHSDANVYFQFTRGVSFSACRFVRVPSILLAASYNFYEFTGVAVELRKSLGIWRHRFVCKKYTSLTLGCPERHSDANVYFQFP